MPDTNEPQRLADAKARMIETRVCIDDTFGPFDAKLDPTAKWCGSLAPFFTLDTVRELAARTKEMADEFGHDVIETVHVIDGGTDRDGDPRALVIHIRWSHIGVDSESVTSIIQPNDEGLFGIGCWEWPWSFAKWQCACGLDMPWHVTDCGGCGLSRDTQPDQTNTAHKALILKEPVERDDSPPWLRDAEAAYARRQEAAAADKARAAEDQADRINGALIELGITPIALAVVPVGSTTLTPALLVEADPEEELYSVHADWDESEGEPRLVLGHYWNEYPGLRLGRPLRAVDDVVEARREGPTPKPEPKRAGPDAWDLRKIAEDAARNIPSDVTSHDASEITHLLSGVVAAVLCLAFADDRP